MHGGETACVPEEIRPGVYRSRRLTENREREQRTGSGKPGRTEGYLQMSLSPYSILMFLFAGGMLLYAALLGATKDYKLIMRYWVTKPKDKRAYAAQFAKLIALVACAPALSGIVGLFGDSDGIVWIALAVLFAGLVAAIAFGVRLMRKVM